MEYSVNKILLGIAHINPQVASSHVKTNENFANYFFITTAKKKC